MAANTLWGVLAGLSGVAQGASQGFDAYTKNRQTDERIALYRMQAARQEENQQFTRNMTLGNALRDVQKEFGRQASIDPTTGVASLPDIGKEIAGWGGTLPEGAQGPPTPTPTIASVMNDPTLRAQAIDRFGTVGGAPFAARQKAEEARTLARDKSAAAMELWGEKLSSQQKRNAEIAESKAEERALRWQIEQLREGGRDNRAGDKPGKDMHAAAARYAKDITGEIFDANTRETTYSRHYRNFINSGGKVDQIPRRTVAPPAPKKSGLDWLLDRTPKAKVLDDETARRMLREAGGDAEAARGLARQRGYSWDEE